MMSDAYFSLASGDFLQNWSDTNLILVNDDWSLVPSIIGYLGDYTSASPTGVDPRTLLGAVATSVDVIANQTTPNTQNSGGVAEFHLANPTIALNGSGTADAPYIVLHLDASNRENISISYNLRDLDGSIDNAVQQVALQFRTSPDGPWINVSAGYVADATQGPSLAGGVTAVSALLPPEANNAATLQVRIITTNAGGNDEWVGVDDIKVTSEELEVESAGVLSIGDAAVAEGNDGLTIISFTVTREGGSAGPVSASYVVNLGGANAGDFAPGTIFNGTVSFTDGQMSASIQVQIRGDTDFEGNEGFTIALSAPTGGALIVDGIGAGTIENDDAAPTSRAAFINEIHYDDAGADAGEAIEIAGAAGTNLVGWNLILYNGNGGVVDRVIPLSGVIPNQENGYGALSFAASGLQNGSPDGVALVDAAGNVVQFLSYEGAFVATAGPAAGMLSQDIGVEENGVTDGFSLQLTGTGASYEDFTWADASANSFGSVNGDQQFIAADGIGLVSVGDASIAEGDNGSRMLTFTVRRAGGLGGTASADYSVGLGTANGGDLAAGAILNGIVTFGPGQASRTISVLINGDLSPEPNETLLLSLGNPSGPIQIVDGRAVGTILNDDPIALEIYDIQGNAHRSAFEGQTIITDGIVTAVDTNGFYLQDSTGDGVMETSDAIFVFTGTAPGVAVGDSARVRGVVSEFLPGNTPTNLTTTQISSPSVTILSTGNALPTAVLIGTGGRNPPSEVIDDDGMTTYDPGSDAIDFYESLEGMLVTVDAPLVVAHTNANGETYVVASGGAHATGLNSRGGMTISEGDFNPERIQLDDDSGIFAGYHPDFSQGDVLNDVTGILSYSFGGYELLVTQAVTVTREAPAPVRETTNLVGTADRLTIATYNLENLSAVDGQAKIDMLATNVVYSLRAPDIIAVQEIQDADGAGNGSDLSGMASAQRLIDAIVAAGGPRYLYVEVAPSSPNSTGGEPGGNIRNGFLYNAGRVSYVAGSAVLVQDVAYNGSRQPLVANFTFNGEMIVAISVHSTSRIGSDPLMGANQPPFDAGDASRTAQAEALRDHVDGLLAANPALNIAVLGDFNGFLFENGIRALTAGDVLSDLSLTLPDEERYSYLFDGNYQLIDHILVTGGLRNGAIYDAVHLNADQPSSRFRGTDHDPQLASLLIPNRAPIAEGDFAVVAEDATSANLWNSLLSNDRDPSIGARFTITSINTTGTLGSLIFDPATQTLRYVADHDQFDTMGSGETIIDRFTYTISDQYGATSTATVEISVTGTDDGLILFGTNRVDHLVGGAGEDSLFGLNGHDLLYGGGGHDILSGGQGNDRLDGGSGNDYLYGERGNDLLIGGQGRDTFIFDRYSGNDIVADFEFGVDSIFLDGISVRSFRIRDENRDGHLDLQLLFSDGGSATFLGITNNGLAGFISTGVISNLGFASHLTPLQQLEYLA
ncbi:MAG: hypothetical protein H0W74_08635 [Sphingosinicella sp.]|nr:hypothetical protein [Sphingosinicella sp.]